jgi:hypothetical protein
MTAETLKSAQFSAYLSLLRALYVLYRQGMHTNTHHISCMGTESQRPTKTNHKAQPHTNSSSQPPFSMYPPTNQHTTHSNTRELEAHNKDFATNFPGLCTFFLFLSLRWITNNNNLTSFLGNPRPGKARCFWRFASTFFLFFLFPSS